MKNRRVIAGLSGLALATTLLATAAPGSATPESPDDAATGLGYSLDGGRGPATEERASDPYTAKLKGPQARNLGQVPNARGPVEMPTSYPYQPTLDFFRDNPTGPNGELDFNTSVPDLMSHPEIAPRLTEIMAQSDRVSTQVIGRSTQGRDLYLVTVTAPETEAFTAQQTAWRDKIRNNPDAAKNDTALLANYKTPIWISNNIHGNEWEGTDAAMQYIEYLATAPWSEVSSILRNNRIYFSPSLNPDGRTNATRATALGFDPNRDMITLTNPEPESYVRSADAIQAIYAADFHGYTGVLQMEPTGPPHGSNYEYDLYIPHNYALALHVEDHVTAQNIEGNTYLNAPGTCCPPTASAPGTTTTNTGYIKIPYRDTPSGWDDFPPIFTAQYAAFYGAITATVELPWSRNLNAAGQPGTGQGFSTLISPDRAEINTEVAYETMVAIVDYMNDQSNARDLLLNQIETFRRGVAGEPKTALNTSNIADVPGPQQWKAEWDASDDQEPVTLPRAYVIPVGADQRSASDANRLAQRLIDVGIKVGTLDADTTVGGTTYPKGSYVIDMHQPLRGLVNSLLDLGEDISLKLPSMYDISAWSLSYLWGATVDKVGLVTDAPIGSATPISAVTPNHAMPAAGEHMTFDLAGVADYQALNALLADGVKVTMIEDGSVVIGGADHAKVAAVAAQFDIKVEKPSAADIAALTAPTAKGLKSLRVAYTGNQDDRVSLEELGFQNLRQITAATVTSDPAILDELDVIWVGSAFNVAAGPARDAVQAWVDAGGGIVGRGTAALNAATTYGLLSATAVAGNGSGNGIVAVDTPAGSVLAPYQQAASFVSPAVSFTGLGTGTRAEQTYATGNPLLAGHWRAHPTTNPLTSGPESAGGNASVISGVGANGGKALVFGTSVVYRNHPKGGLSQAARGLLWAASEGAKVEPPVVQPPVTEPPVPGKAVSRTTLKVKKIKGTRQVRLVIRVKAGALTPTGKIAIRRNGKKLRVINLPAKRDGVRRIKVRLGKGQHRLKAVYRGSATVERSSSPTRVVRFK